VPAGTRLADIGSDHGYLLVALMKRGMGDETIRDILDHDKEHLTP
jgi:tRNA A22 N-methylase